MEEVCVVDNDNIGECRTKKESIDNNIEEDNVIMKICFTKITHVIKIQKTKNIEALLPFCRGITKTDHVIFFDNGNIISNNKVIGEIEHQGELIYLMCEPLYIIK